MTPEEFGSPADHTAAEVVAYLDDPTTSPDEAQRVRQEEANGKNRLTVAKAATEAVRRPALPEGSEFVTEAPDGVWSRLVDESGEPVQVNGAWVAVP